MFVRVAHWSRRSPVIHASSVARCFVSGWTLRTLQQSSRFSTLSVHEVAALLADHALDVLVVRLDDREIEAGIVVAEPRDQVSRVSSGRRPVSTEKTLISGSIL